mmetsp:Transcript_22833/g.34274  ORF Transcript_22833/g.34274 Transcript_22833/m.34274 type:complete len:314 (-) Transcript_22833:77-1018(-)
MTGISSTHHVLGIEGLSGELRDSQYPKGIRLIARQRSETNEEEVKTREGDHVHRQLTQIAIQLTRESETTSSSGHGCCNQVVQVAIAGVLKLECTEANIVKRLVIKCKALIGVLHQLMDRKRSIVRLHDSITDLGRGNNRVRAHDTIGVFLSNLGHEEGTHTRPRSSTHGVRNLKSLQHIARFSLFADNVHNAVHQFSSLSIVTLGPVVTSTRLSKDKVIRAEDLAHVTSANGVHCSWLQIRQNRSGDVASVHTLVEVHVDSFELEVKVAAIGTIALDAVLLGHNLPEFCTDLVTALSCLQMNDFSHVVRCVL